MFVPGTGVGVVLLRSTPKNSSIWFGLGSIRSLLHDNSPLESPLPVMLKLKPSYADGAIDVLSLKDPVQPVESDIVWKAAPNLELSTRSEISPCFRAGVASSFRQIFLSIAESSDLRHFLRPDQSYLC